MTDSLLIIGSGGREHALAWKLSQSSSVKHIYVAPGNAGTQTDSTGKVSNIDINIKDNEKIADWCKEKKINLVVVGPEDPLANGLADYLNNNKIKCFGPSQKAAQIEASKEFAKHFMDRHKIPTAKWKSFTNVDDAKKHILSAPYNALVVKASGLAAGKGVIVAASREDALKAVETLKQDKSLSSATSTIVVEELLSGEETSVLCFTDGTHIAVMPPAQDHKRLLDNDEGPNTGGMGAYCKCPQVSEEEIKFIQENILQRAVDGMKADGSPYIGVLYAGLMMTSEGPKVLEFNCRFGDPETQVLLPLLNSDLYQLMLDCVHGSLDKNKVQWLSDKFAVGVVVVSGGYPGSYPKGEIITGLGELKDHIVFHAGTAIKSGKIVTSGGRVLAVVAIEDSLQKAAVKAESGAAIVNFDGAFYRKDIAHKALKRSYEGITYKSSGVDIESADALVDKIKTLTRQTLRPGVCGGIGGFGGIFDLKAAGFDDAYLVSRGAGIGEKLMAAQECGNFELIGYDLVSNCVNEIISQGAEPLFFLDTFTTGKLDTSTAAKVIQGIVKGCKEANCALIGGETAEMPGMYADGDFDLTGFARGAVKKELLLPHKNEISNGDCIIGLLSSAVNPAGFEIIRKILKKEKLSINSSAPFEKNLTIEKCLLLENKIHVQSILPLVQKKQIKAAAYVNEGGLCKNLKRILPLSYKVKLDSSKWVMPSIYKWIAEKENFSQEEMLENFNCGIDMVLIVENSIKNLVLDSLKSSDENAAIVGTIELCEEGDKRIQLSNPLYHSKHSSNILQIRTAIFTSGQALNTAALISYTQNPINISTSEIAVVISDSDDSEGVSIAKKSNILTKVFSSEEFTGNFSTVEDYLKSSYIQLICLDNFNFPLSSVFLRSWKGKVLNIHNSLLPAFDGPNALKEMLELKVRITGCTAYFLEPESKFGAIIEQSAVFVDIDDTEETLHQKVSRLEQYLYPKALELVASKRIYVGSDSKLMRIDDSLTISNFVVSHHEILQKKVHDLISGTARSGFQDSDSSCGVFDLKASGYDDPLLVSGTDGVGTKLKIAQICNKHDTIGIDLVAMCVNDILTHGAEPLFFMQCLNSGQLNPDITADVISGIVNGCKQANCALINSEISLLPDIYLNKEYLPDFNNYDVVGYAEGALSRQNLLPKINDINENDVVIGIESSGIHSNGYSLVRKLVKIRNLRYQDPAPFDSTKTLGEVLLTPTKIYVKSLLPLMKKGYIKAAAHITGGGITENIPRVLPPEFKVVLDGHKWSVTPVLKWIAKEGQMSTKEMLKTFNCGLGMVLIVDQEHEEKILEHLKLFGEIASNVGRVKKLLKEDEEKVLVQNFCLNLQPTSTNRKKIGVLISGSGTNLQALIDYTQNPSNQSKAEIVLVLSNVPGVEGLKRAERANIPTKVLSHKGFKSRVDFDMSVNSILQKSNVEIVCLAGFMRILSKEFVKIWQGKLLNVHPAILPAFKGMNAHKQVLETGARITGCTVHFVEPEVDAGAIIEQAAVKVSIDDTEKSLQEKVKILEHQIFPIALELLANEKISRGCDGKLLWQCNV